MLLYKAAKDNPNQQVFAITDDPNGEAGVDTGIWLNRTKNNWFQRMKDFSKFRPYSEVFLDFKNGYAVNLNDNTAYPLTNAKTSPTWLFSINIDGDIILVDKFERLAEVQVTHPQAVHGGLKKVVQGFTAILGSVCIFDGNGAVIDFKKGGMLSDGSPVPDCLPRGTKPLGEDSNHISHSEALDLNTDKSAEVSVFESFDPRFSSHLKIWEIKTSIAGSKYLRIGTTPNKAFKFRFKVCSDTPNCRTRISSSSDRLIVSATLISGDCSIEAGAVGTKTCYVRPTANVSVLEIEYDSLTDFDAFYIYPDYNNNNGTVLVQQLEMYTGDGEQYIPTYSGAVTRVTDEPQMPAKLLGTLTQLTLAAKCSFSTGKHEVIFERAHMYIKRHGLNDRIYVYDNNGLSSNVLLDGTQVIPPDTLATIIVVIDDDRLKLFVNGVKVREEVRDLGVNPFGGDALPLNIGQDSGASCVQNPIESALIAQRAMSDAEVLELHNFLMEN